SQHELHWRAFRSDERVGTISRRAELDDRVDFLREAEAVTADIMPRMATHAAYYAMFHAARAVLVQVDGLGAPTKHHAVVGRFGQLAKLANDAQLMAAGRLINGAQNDRLRSDYNTGRTPLPSEAA